MTDGWFPNATRVPVTTFTPGGQAKVGFCDHTAGGFYTTLATASFWNGRHTSVHFGIGRKGEICQMVSIFDRCWGQGEDANGNPVGPHSPGVSWPPFEDMGYRSPNEYLIGFEHEDAETINGETRFIPGPVWTPAQYAADLAVKRWCRGEHLRVKGLELMAHGLDSLAGHHMFDPSRRANCPGPVWRNEYRNKLYVDLLGVETPLEEDMIRHNAIAPYFDGRAIVGDQGMDARGDFGLPQEARVVRLEVYMAPSAPTGSLQFFDGVSLTYAGQVGWDGARYGLVDVAIPDGALLIRGTGTIARLGCVGYW